MNNNERKEAISKRIDEIKRLLEEKSHNIDLTDMNADLAKKWPGEVEKETQRKHGGKATGNTGTTIIDTFNHNLIKFEPEQATYPWPKHSETITLSIDDWEGTAHPFACTRRVYYPLFEVWQIDGLEVPFWDMLDDVMQELYDGCVDYLNLAFGDSHLIGTFEREYNAAMTNDIEGMWNLMLASAISPNENKSPFGNTYSDYYAWSGFDEKVCEKYFPDTQAECLDRYGDEWGIIECCFVIRMGVNTRVTIRLKNHEWQNMPPERYGASEGAYDYVDYGQVTLTSRYIGYRNRLAVVFPETVSYNRLRAMFDYSYEYGINVESWYEVYLRIGGNDDYIDVDFDKEYNNESSVNENNFNASDPYIIYENNTTVLIADIDWDTFTDKYNYLSGGKTISTGATAVFWYYKYITTDFSPPIIVLTEQGESGESAFQRKNIGLLSRTRKQRSANSIMIDFAFIPYTTITNDNLHTYAKASDTLNNFKFITFGGDTAPGMYHSTFYSADYFYWQYLNGTWLEFIWDTFISHYNKAEKLRFCTGTCIYEGETVDYSQFYWCMDPSQKESGDDQDKRFTELILDRWLEDQGYGYRDWYDPLDKYGYVFVWYEGYSLTDDIKIEYLKYFVANSDPAKATTLDYIAEAWEATARLNGHATTTNDAIDRIKQMIKLTYPEYVEIFPNESQQEGD